MGIQKIKLSLLFYLILLMSCNQEPVITSEEYISLLKENESLKNEKEEILKSTIQQFENIDHIYDQLSGLNADIDKITIQSSSYEIPVEYTRIMIIDNYIENIKKEIDILEKSNSHLNIQNGILSKTIQYFKTTIIEKEKEIREYKETLKIKDNIIADQTTTINQKNNIIQDQTLIISNKNAEIEIIQIKKWSDMGTELYQLYEEYQDFSSGVFKKSINKHKMLQNKKNVLIRAQECFNEAIVLGSKTDSANLERVKQSLNSITQKQ